MSYQLHVGKCEIVLKSIPDNSVDSIVTDPPYEINFLSRKWDNSGIAYNVDMWQQCLRVLKPGGHILSFGATRTYHRMACAIEDAGFDIRDTIGWIYGQGFPHSHNLDGEFEGWGTCLKPAWESICLARKPFDNTVAENMAKYGVGALNIAATRIEGEPVPIYRLEKRPDYQQEVNTLGRWPANIAHDGSDEVLDHFPDSAGQLADISTNAPSPKTSNVFGKMNRCGELSKYIDNNGLLGYKMKPGMRRLDSGSAARFFYCSKTSKDDRNEGCESIQPKQYSHDGRNTPIDNAYQRNSSNSSNSHPTCKPTSLMGWLCKLITPTGGTVLDPFTGSGSTGKAAMMEGFKFISIEQSEEYAAIAEARIKFGIEERNISTAQREMFA